MTDEVLADQVDYYRRRAGEYDMTAYGDVAAARARIARLVAEMRPAGSVLEIACGTGLWTEALAGWADTVTAMAGLLGHVGVEIEIDRYRAGEIDAYAADETIHHYHRAAQNSGSSASPEAAALTPSSSSTSSTA